MPAPTFCKVSQANRQEVDFPGRIRSPPPRLKHPQSPDTYDVAFVIQVKKKFPFLFDAP